LVIPPGWLLDAASPGLNGFAGIERAIGNHLDLDYCRFLSGFVWFRLGQIAFSCP
jgi:hypothetical protein